MRVYLYDIGVDGVTAEAPHGPYEVDLEMFPDAPEERDEAIRVLQEDGYIYIGGGAAAVTLLARVVMLDGPERESFTIARKWVARFGWGFHPDTRGVDYRPTLTHAEIADYEADMERLFSLPTDPYAVGVQAMEERYNKGGVS